MFAVIIGIAIAWYIVIPVILGLSQLFYIIVLLIVHRVLTDYERVTSPKKK